MRYEIFWANGDNEYCQCTLVNYALLVYLEEAGELIFYLEDMPALRNRNGEVKYDLARVEKTLIEQALRENKFEFQAADQLGISPRALNYKKKKFGILKTGEDNGS